MILAQTSNEVISVSAGPHTIEESSCLGVQLQEIKKQATALIGW